MSWNNLQQSVKSRMLCFVRSKAELHGWIFHFLRETDKMIQIIPSVFRLITNRVAKLPPFSVTSTLPSIMNGGKDFSPWSKIDDLLYQTMRIPVEAVLGKDGVGLADCAIAESKFEKGEDISGRILLLVSQLGEVQKKGTPDIEFAMVGLLARSQIALGRAEDALRTVQMARERFEENGHTRFFHNIDAVLCRIWLIWMISGINQV